MQVQQKLAFRHGRNDVDKAIEEMNEDEKEVFEAMQDEANDEKFEEIEDDFVLMLNGGLPAIQLDEEEEKAEVDEAEDDQIVEGPNKNNNTGVMVVSDDGPMGGIENPLIPNYKEKMADIIALLDKQQEMRMAP